MGSPVKLQRRPAQVTTSRLSEPSLPLHLALAHLIVNLFPALTAHTKSNPQINPYSSSFTCSILTLIAREVYEVLDTARSYKELSDEVELLLKKERKDLRRANDKLRARGQAVSVDRERAEDSASWMDNFAGNFQTLSDGCTYLDFLEKELACRISDRLEDDEEEDPAEHHAQPIERRSPLGLFARGLLLTLRKLSFDESSHLALQTSTWCGLVPADSRFPVLATSSVLRLNRKLALDDTLEKRVKAIQELQQARDSGDFEAALRSLRRFYDYQFPHAGRGQHQHALLNIAAFQYQTGGSDSAKAAIDEAIRVARSEGDNACLRHCMSLYHRISTETSISHSASSSVPRISTQPLTPPQIPKIQTPMDELWALQIALDQGESVPTAFRRIHKSLARHEQTRTRKDKRDAKGGWTVEHEWDEGVWYTTQAGLWAKLGSMSLAELYEEIAETGADLSMGAKFAILYARAQRAADEADFDSALAMLLDLSNVQGMTITEYSSWSSLVWAILARQLRNSNQHTALAIVDHNRGHPLRHHKWNGNEPSAAEGKVCELLRKAQKMRDASAPAHLVLPHILSANQLASQLGLWKVYRLSVVALGEVLLDMEGPGMALRARQQIGDIWDQILRLRDDDLIARGGLVMGRAELQIAMDDGTDDFAPAIAYIQRAMHSGTRLCSRKIILECTNLLSLLSELRGERGEREEMVLKWAEARAGGQEDGAEERAEQQVRSISEVVGLVGVRVAQGWR